MEPGYSYEDLLDFLDHASQRGLMPTATAQALAVGVRNVFGLLDEEERRDLRRIDLEQTIRRFSTRRARDFNPSSLRTYGSRAKTALEHFLTWRENPAAFNPKRRATTRKHRTGTTPPHREASVDQGGTSQPGAGDPSHVQMGPHSYQTSFPLRAGHVIQLFNVPHDLTSAEAERLATFVRMLVVE